MRHFAEVENHRASGNVASDRYVERVSGGDRFFGREQVPQGDQGPMPVGHLDADGRSSRYGREDAYVGRRHRVGDIAVERRQSRHLDAGTQFEFVTRDGGPHRVAHECRLHPVGAERFDEFATRRLDGRAVLSLLLGSLEQIEGGQDPFARQRSWSRDGGQLGARGEYRFDEVTLVVRRSLFGVVLVLVVLGIQRGGRARLRVKSERGFGVGWAFFARRWRSVILGLELRLRPCGPPTREHVGQCSKAPRGRPRQGP